MILLLRVVLLAVLAASLLHVDAQAQMPDEVALLPSETDVVEAMIGEPFQKRGDTASSRERPGVIMTGQCLIPAARRAARSSIACSPGAR